jgi:hypothetical protein
MNSLSLKGNEKAVDEMQSPSTFLHHFFSTTIFQVDVFVKRDVSVKRPHECVFGNAIPATFLDKQ